MSRPNHRPWIIAWHWRDRILNFEPSWFTIIMGTGVVQTTYVNFPYPITGSLHWLRDIGYCLWILEIVLFGLFMSFLITRYIRHPNLLKKNILEFPNSSYFGAIAIAWNTITQGAVSYYDYRSSAAWAVFVMYWMGLLGSLCVSIGIVIIQMTQAKKQELSDVAGVWVMTTVPLLTTASTAGTILPFVNRESTKAAIAVLVTGHMSWFLAMSELLFILTIFFFRFIAYKMPAKPLLASSFLPATALSQAAYAIQKLSIYLANYIKSSGFGPTQVNPPPLSTATLEATSEVIHWMGILVSLGLLAHATFCKSPDQFLTRVIQASYGIILMLPSTKFSISHWSVVFPVASYANAWSYLARDLRNDGMRGWAATFTVIGSLAWIFCATMTTYLGFWKGSLFSAPGLEDWVGDNEEQDEEARDGRRDYWNGTYTLPDPGSRGNRDLEGGQVDGQGDGYDERRNTSGEARRRN